MSTEFSHWWKNQWPGAWSGDQCSPCQWKNVTWQVSDVRNCGCGAHSRVYFDCSLFACNYVSTGWVSELCEWRIFPNLSPGLERHPNPRHSWVIIPTRGSVSHRWWYSPTMNIFLFSKFIFSWMKLRESCVQSLWLKDKTSNKLFWMSVLINSFFQLTCLHLTDVAPNQQSRHNILCPIYQADDL